MKSTCLVFFLLVTISAFGQKQFFVELKNPVSDSIDFSFYLPQKDTIHVRIYNLWGTKQYDSQLQIYEEGGYHLKIKNTLPKEGAYVFYFQTNNSGEAKGRIINLVTGIFSIDTNNVIQAFPNPFGDFITIRDDETYSYSLTDFNGKKQEILFEKAQGKIKINTSNLIPGIYFLELKSNLEITRIKLIKL